MADIKDRAREYLAKNSEYNEVYGEFFVAVDTMTAMIEFAEQETKELKEQIEIDAKQIRALQKQNGELTDKVRELEHQLTHRNCLDCSNHSSKLRMRTLELEKENAELKETLKTYNGCGDWDNDFHTCRVYLQHEELQMYIDQLTKAKELLERLLITSCNSDVLNLLPNCSEVLRVRVKAEQFLSEVEK